MARRTARATATRCRSTNTGCRSRRTATSSTTRRWSCARKACTTGTTAATRSSTARRACSASPRDMRGSEIADAVQRAVARARLRRAVHARPSEAVRARDARRRAHARRPRTASSSPTPGSEAVDTAMKVALAYHQARGPGRPHDVRLARARVSRREFRRRVAVRHRQQPAQVRADAAGHRAHAPHAHQGKPLHAAAKARTARSWPKTSCAS